MEVIYRDGVKYNRENFALESEFEKIVLSQYRYIFGENSILFDKRKLVTATGIGTIPDAFVLCPDKKKWYVVEVELACHSVYGHIIPQIAKFKTALKTDRRKLLKFFDEQIESDLRKRADWHIATGSHNNIHRAISDLVDTEPEILIIIDDLNTELLAATDSLGYQTYITIFKCFGHEAVGRGDSIYLFEPIEKSVTKNSRPIQKAINASTPPNSPMTLETKQVAALSEDTEATHLSPVLRKTQNPSPSPYEWTVLIPELQNRDQFKNWKSICDHFSVDYKGDSGRRALKRWVEKNKPEWPPVP